MFKPSPPKSAKEAMSFLTGKSTKGPTPASPASEDPALAGDKPANSEVYSAVKSLVDKYGMEAIRTAVDKCDEGVEGTEKDDDTDSAADLEPITEQG